MRRQAAESLERVLGAPLAAGRAVAKGPLRPDDRQGSVHRQLRPLVGRHWRFATRSGDGQGATKRPRSSAGGCLNSELKMAPRQPSARSPTAPPHGTRHIPGGASLAAPTPCAPAACYAPLPESAAATPARCHRSALPSSGTSSRGRRTAPSHFARAGGQRGRMQSHQHPTNGRRRCSRSRTPGRGDPPTSASAATCRTSNS